MTIARLIEGRTTDIVSCEAATSVRDAVRILAEQRIGAMPVYAGGSLAGIFSERDVVSQLAAGGPAILDRSVGEVMTAPAITVERATGILEALGLMTRRRIRHLPVVEDGAVMGVLSIGDLVKAVIEQQRQELDHLQRYIAS